MGSLIKSKAVFQILILILAIFTISLMNPEIARAENKVCCEKTKEISPYGVQSCIYTEIENCDTSVKPSGGNYQASSVGCEQTDYCKPVCCISEGICDSNVLKADCLENNGAFNIDASCNIQQCQNGCCSLPDGASFVTQVECGNMIEPYSALNLDDVFDASITDEYSCLLESLSAEEGCCVTSSECTWGTRAECNQKSGDFKLETLCSYPALGCEVTEQHHLGCLEGKSEVYWFDSAGNPENIYGTNYGTDGKRVLKEASCYPNDNNVENTECGNCNYNLGSICAEASDGFLQEVEDQGLDPNKINYMCQDLNCYDLYDGGTANSQRWGGELHTASDGREYRANGESWCEYEGAVGYGQDLVGSRHYRRYCMNGKEYVEPCDEKRNSICVQNVISEEISGIEGGISGAICQENLWQGCFTDENGEQIKTQEDCEALGKDCFWDSSVTFGGNTEGMCVPMVPAGGFEEDDGACFKELTFTEFWVKHNAFDAWDCESNCWINNNGKEFSNSMWGLCRSLGDCGDYYNVVGTRGSNVDSSFNIQRTGGRYGTVKGYDFLPFNQLELGKASNYINGDLFWLAFVNQYAGAINLHNCGTGSVCENAGSLNNIVGYVGVIAGITVGLLVALTSVNLVGLLTLGGVGAISGTGAAVSLGAQEAGLSSFLTGASPWATVAIVAWFVLAASILAYLLISGADSQESPFTFTCEHWNPPVGGADCERCDEFTKCDQYKCESLGAACKFINDNGEEACVWENRGDALAPVIGPLPIAPKTISNFEVTPSGQGNIEGGLNGGYEFKDIIDSYTPVEIGIKTEERAQCKISRILAKPYDEMTTSFGTGYLYNHTFTIPVSYDQLTEDQVAISGGGDYMFYVKCMDVNGNKNIHDYFIKFEVSEAPDMTAPIIQDFSIQNNAFLPHSLNETELVVYLNEPASSIGGCRYSRIDKDYELMEYNMTCLQAKIQGDYYGCVEPSLEILPNVENTWYFRCRDNSGNINTQSYAYTLKSSESLNMINVGPEGDVYNTTITLTATTEKGAENGKAKCYYSLTNYFDPNGLLFMNTDSTTHSNLMYLQNEQDYTFYIWCRDIAGNEDNKIASFYITTTDLNISSLLPSNNSKFYTNNVLLQITTIGGYNGNGESDCYYNSNNINDDVQTSNSQTIHKENVTGLTSGNYNYEIKCDDGYKEDKKYLYFEVDLQSVPEILQVYITTNLLNIVTSTQAECRYTTIGDFTYDSGTSMATSNNILHQAYIGNNNVFYIRCKDKNTNIVSDLYTIYI